MPDTFRLGPGAELTLTRHDDELVEVRAAWEPTDSPPPMHLHPDQDEHFEMLEGEMTVEADGERRTLRAGDTYDIPRGTAHCMWNSGDTTARGVWQTRPAGRTIEFFTFVDEMTRNPPADEAAGAAAGEKLQSFSDTFKLV
jgi:uncharacterized cupin superfamily protein